MDELIFPKKEWCLTNEQEELCSLTKDLGSKRFSKRAFKYDSEASFPIENYRDLELDNILNKNKGLKIGISWKSFKNRYSSEKSLSLEDFENVLDIKKTIIFNLQYGDVKEELETFTKKRSHKIITLENLDLFNNFSGLANVLKYLDLFFTVSNSTAHLSSALGVRTILIKPINHASFHYWDYDDGKTPWYKSVNIISKEKLKDKYFIKELIKL